ncbi:Hypothetical predicted protein [Prunus dulcis]|uniref:DUF4283 domain-containing protein n=1 Tax=Prunus dulcis TaxID=3755 RepID=A0A5E4FX58_PRUDU|nr:Hypothetical predicted protein [Prunus dulcis]
MFKGLSCVFSSRIFNRSSLGRTLTQSWRLQGRVSDGVLDSELGSLKLTSCPFWIQFHDLPIDCRGEKMVALIGSRFREVSKIDLGKNKMALFVKDTSGCGLLGHEERSCSTKNFGCGIQYSNDLRDVIVSKKGHLRLPVSSSNFSYGSWGSGGLKFARGSDGGGRVPVEERRAGREALNGDRFGKVVSHMNVNENDLGEDSGDVDINGAFLNESGKESNGLKKITIGKCINAAQSGHSSHGRKRVMRKTMETLEVEGGKRRKTAALIKEGEKATIPVTGSAGLPRHSS